MAKKPTVKVFRLQDRGLARVLGSLEAAVMEAVWARGEASIREVQQALARDQPLSFNTVMTVMNRLVQKGLLQRTAGKPGSLYRPAVDRAEFCRTVVRDATQGLVADFGELAVTQFVEALNKVDPSLLQRLAGLLTCKGRSDAE